MADAYSCSAQAREIARKAGFDKKEQDEIALCATEICTNMVLHAGCGVLWMREISHKGQKGIELHGVDNGPGIADTEAVLADAESGRGGYGCGLGTLHRLMDMLEVVSPSDSGQGTSVRCSRTLKSGEKPVSGTPLDAGAATRPMPGQKFNGDAFVIKAWEHNLLVGAIDGLGHGQYAHKASQNARHFIESHYQLPLKTLFQGVDRACRATRGIVMVLGLFDWRLGKVQLAGVGNIEVRHTGPSDVSFVSRRGFLGNGLRPVHVRGFGWSDKDVLVMYSDGLRGHWSWKEYSGLSGLSANEAAMRLLKEHARDRDDATILIVKGR